jgi:hypothetical protein
MVYDIRVNENVLLTYPKEQRVKMFLAPAFGGLGLSLLEGYDLVRALSYENGSEGWLAQIGSGGNYFAPWLHPEVLEWLKAPNAVLAGSGKASGIATRENDGWRISGSWAYCSGAENAHFFTFVALDYDTKENVTFAISAKQVAVANDWVSFGMQHTQSHTVHVKEQWVPDTHCFDLTGAMLNPALCSVSAVPFMDFALASFLPVLVGCFHRFSDEIMNFVEFKEQADQYQTGPIPKLEMYASEFIAYENEAKQIIAQLFEESNAFSPDLAPTQLLFRQHCLSYVSFMRKAILEGYFSMGLKATMPKYPWTEPFLDFMTAGQHVVFKEAIVEEM